MFTVSNGDNVDGGAGPVCMVCLKLLQILSLGVVVVVAAAPFACRPCSRRRDCVLRQVKPKYQPKVEDWMQEHMRLDGMRSGFQLFQQGSCEVPVLKDRCDSY